MIKLHLGPRATLVGPPAVLEALWRQFFQSPSKKGGVLAQTSPTSKNICTVSGGYSDTTFWTVAWSFLRVQQAIIPHLKEGSLGYLLIQKS